MRTCTLLILLLALGGAGASTSRADSRVEAPSEAESRFPYDRARAATLRILIDGHLGGSGFIVSPDGYAITAEHVLGKPGVNVEAVIDSGQRIGASVVAVDSGHDLVLLKLPERADGGEYRHIRIAEEAPEPGEPVYLLGHPIYRHNVLFAGVQGKPEPSYEWIGNQNRYIESYYFTGLAPRGVSGGPWFNRKGELIGLQSGAMISSRAQVGVAFVAPMKSVEKLLETKQSARTPTLGAAFEELWEKDAGFIARFPKGASGAVVAVLAPKSPLAEAEVRVSELVQSANGKPVMYRDELLREVRKHKPGDVIELKLLTPAGDERTVGITLGCLEQAWLEHLGEAERESAETSADSAVTGSN